LFGAAPSAARWPAAQGRFFFFAYPALIPHPGSPGLGSVPGYFQPSRQGGTGAPWIEVCSVSSVEKSRGDIFSLQLRGDIILELFVAKFALDSWGEQMGN
jgi:hypothetical protein